MNKMKEWRAILLAIATVLALCIGVAPASSSAASSDLFNNTNTSGVVNSPTRATVFTLNATAQITELVTYHWNNGQGATPGTISLYAATGQTYGPYQVHATSGQNNAPNVNWIADINVTVPAGSYTVLDSDPATWSYNMASGHAGFAIVRGTYAPAPSPTSSPCTGPSKALYINTNTAGVQNGPPNQPAFYLSSPACITEVATYHWNNGQGAAPGVITLQLHSGRRVQNFSMLAQGTAGQGGAPNVNWVATTNIIIPAGIYLVLDSDPATWSSNAQSAYRGFVTVTGRQ